MFGDFFENTYSNVVCSRTSILLKLLWKIIFLLTVFYCLPHRYSLPVYILARFSSVREYYGSCSNTRCRVHMYHFCKTTRTTKLSLVPNYFENSLWTKFRENRYSPYSLTYKKKSLALFRFAIFAINIIFTNYLRLLFSPSWASGNS